MYMYKYPLVASSRTSVLQQQHTRLRMKTTTTWMLALLAASLAPASPTLIKRAPPKGIDVSNFQGHVDFGAAKAKGISFAYIKATEGTSTFLHFDESCIHYGQQFVQRSSTLILMRTTLVRLTQDSFAADTILHTQTLRLALRRRSISLHMAVRLIVLGPIDNHLTAVRNAGGWSSDGITLPGAVDLEGKRSSQRPVFF